MEDAAAGCGEGAAATCDEDAAAVCGDAGVDVSSEEGAGAFGANAMRTPDSRSAVSSVLRAGMRPLAGSTGAVLSAVSRIELSAFASSTEAGSRSSGSISSTMTGAAGAGDSTEEVELARGDSTAGGLSEEDTGVFGANAMRTPDSRIALASFAEMDGRASGSISSTLAGDGAGDFAEDGAGAFGANAMRTAGSLLVAGLVATALLA